MNSIKECFMKNQINEDNIRVAAYYIWEQAGRPEGQEKECWIKACEQLFPTCTCDDTCTKKSCSKTSTKTTTKSPCSKTTCSNTTTKTTSKLSSKTTSMSKSKNADAVSSKTVKAQSVLKTKKSLA